MKTRDTARKKARQRRLTAAQLVIDRALERRRADQILLAERTKVRALTTRTRQLERTIRQLSVVSTQERQLLDHVRALPPTVRAAALRLLRTFVPEGGSR